MRGVELVVSHYNGELDWIREVRSLFQRVTVYHKGPMPLHLEPDLGAEVVPLPNVGREAHTYLTHVVRRYGDLADRTVFSQDGYADKLSPDAFRRICQGEALINHQTVDVPWEHSIVQYWPSYKGVPMHPTGLNQRAFFDRYILRNAGVEECAWLNGAYVTVRRDEIQRRPCATYERLLSETGLSEQVNPEAAYLMERAWYALWEKPAYECVWL